MNRFLITVSVMLSVTSTAIAQESSLICESYANHTFSAFEIGAEPSHTHDNYTVVIELDIDSEELLGLTGDLTFRVFGNLISCDNPDWQVRASSDQIVIWSSYTQCGELLTSGFAWTMIINRYTGSFTRTLGDISTGPVVYAEGYCATADRRF